MTLDNNTIRIRNLVMSRLVNQAQLFVPKLGKQNLNFKEQNTSVAFREVLPLTKCEPRCDLLKISGKKANQ